MLKLYFLIINLSYLPGRCNVSEKQALYAANMRIVPLGSGGAILDLDWLLNYHDIKLVIQVSEIEGKDDLLAYAKH
jgi:hypothetical protein